MYRLYAGSRLCPTLASTKLTLSSGRSTANPGPDTLQEPYQVMDEQEKPPQLQHARGPVRPGAHGRPQRPDRETYPPSHPAQKGGTSCPASSMQGGKTQTSLASARAGPHRREHVRGLGHDGHHPTGCLLQPTQAPVGDEQAAGRAGGREANTGGSRGTRRPGSAAS